MANFFKIKMFNQPEEEINFDSFTKLPFFLLRFFFFKFDLLSENPSFWEKLEFHARNSYYRLVNIGYVLIISSLITFTQVNSHDFEAAVKGTPNVASAILISMKGFVPFYNRDQFRAIMKELKQLVEGHDRFQGKMKEHLDYYHRIMKFYSGTFAFVFFPIVLVIFPYLISGEMKLTVDYWFPFDAYTHRTYIIAMLIVDWFSYVMLVSLLSSDSLLYSLITLIVMEFDILKIELANLKSIQADQRRGRIAELTERHNTLIVLCDKLQSMFSMVFLFSFVISSFIMCFVSFQLSSGEASFDTYSFYIPYLAMIGGQVFLLCTFGQNLIDSSNDVAEGVFDCGWESFDDNNVKKLLVLIIRRAHRPCRLTAMNFAEISRTSFTTVRSKQMKNNY